MSPTVVAFVPMKMTNQRLPNKHRLPLAGIPLFLHIFRALAGIGGLDGCYAWVSEPGVADDLPDGVTFVQRDARFDGPTVKGLELFAGFARDVPADLYLLAHATAPFLTTESIRKGLDGVLSGTFDTAHAVRRIQTYCWFKGQPVNYDPSDMVRTQDLEPVLVETSGFYVYSRREILERHRRIGDNPMLVEVSETEAIDIDYPEDYAMARRFEDLLTQSG